MVETVVFDHICPHSTMKKVNQSSCMTLWPMMMHHHVTFGSIKVQQLRRYRPDEHSLEF